MKQISELLETGIYVEEEVKIEQTVRDFIESINLEVGHFGVLIDGKKVDLDYVLKLGEKPVLIPTIKGG